jgi:hypothetical protein
MEYEFEKKLAKTKHKLDWYYDSLINSIEIDNKMFADIYLRKLQREIDLFFFRPGDLPDEE